MIFAERERKCPVCGKIFLVAPQNTYKLYIDGIKQDLCSYTCFRKEQKKQERGKKKYHRM